MRFANLGSAGRSLASALKQDHSPDGAIVLGIVRGGVPAAFEVGAALDLPLDLLISRGLFQRPNGETIRAARIAGTLVLDDELRSPPERGGTVEEIFVADALAALVQREAECRGSRPVAPIAGKTVLVVDNGMRTGKTMAAAIRLIRKLDPARIVTAIPVATNSALREIRPLADELVCLLAVEQMGHVGLFYDQFDVPGERQIHEILRSHEAGRRK